jgi:dihydroorotate dehydrogenase
MGSYDLAKSLLFRMDPERAHTVGMFFLKHFVGEQTKESDKKFARTAFGELRNPVGLAAGFDKSGKHISVLQKLGFGYIVAGTITLDPWPGHPKPRIIRNAKERTLLNCLGFPNPGAEEFIQNISGQDIKIPLLVSLSGRTASSIIECYQKLEPHVSALELNLSSPNTKDLKDLRETDSFRSLALELSSIRHKKPTYLKVPPFIDSKQTVKNVEMIKVWQELGFEGVTASNSVPISDARLSVGSGGLSGPQLLRYTIDAVREIRNIAPRNFEINAVGGVSRGADVQDLLNRGATTVQLYTSLVYDGPGVVRNILRKLNVEAVMGSTQSMVSPSSRRAL